MAEPEKRVPITQRDLDDAAAWIDANQDKAGSPDFVKAADFFRQGTEFLARTQPSGKGDLHDAVGAGMGGFNKGFAGFFDLPGYALRFGLNKASNALGYGDVLDPTKEGAFTTGMRKGGFVPPEHGWNMTSRIGEGAGGGTAAAVTLGPLAGPARAAGFGRTGAVFDAMGPSTAGTPFRSAAKTVADQVVGTTAQETAQEGVRNAGGGQFAEMLAGFGAPMTIPALQFGLKNTGGRLLGKMLGDPQSPQRYDLLKQNGITPTPGLVGGPMVARMENAATYVPFFKGGADRRTQSFHEFQNQIYDLSDQIGRTDQSLSIPTGPKGHAINTARETGIPTQPEVGARFGDNAREGRNLLMNELQTQQNALEQGIGPQTLVPPGQTVPNIRNMAETEVNGQTRARTDTTGQQGFQSEIDKFNAVRVPQHPQLEGLLQTEIRSRMEMLNDPTMRPNQRQQLLSELDGLQARLEQNRQVPYEALKDLSTNAGYAATPGGTSTATLGQHQIGGVKDQYRAMQEFAANRAGLGAEFADATQRYRAAMDDRLPLKEGGDIPYLDKLRGKSDQSAYDDVMASGQWERADVLARNNPAAAPAMKRDMLLSRSEAPVRNQAEGIDVSPMAFTTRWKGMSPQAKDQLALPGTPERVKLEELAQVGQMYMDRAGTMNFSNTAPSAATAVTMSNIWNHPVQTAKAVGSAIGSGILASSPDTAAMMAGRYNWRTDPRMMSMAQSGIRTGTRELADSLYPDAPPMTRPLEEGERPPLEVTVRPRRR